MAVPAMTKPPVIVNDRANNVRARAARQLTPPTTKPASVTDCRSRYCLMPYAAAEHEINA